MKILVIIDNGHGIDTPGKCSPDKRLLEWAWTRDIARMLAAELERRGIEAALLVTEDADVPLRERCRRANALCAQRGAGGCLLVSIHSNAAGADGQWKSAGGWCVYTSPGKTKADDLATCIWEAANRVLQPYAERFKALLAQGAYDRRQVPFRADWSDGDPDYEARFAILTGTKCPAVLTESLFQDNRADAEFLLSDEGKRAIVQLHADGIEDYIKRL